LYIDCFILLTETWMMSKGDRKTDRQTDRHNQLLKQYNHWFVNPHKKRWTMSKWDYQTDGQYNDEQKNNINTMNSEWNPSK